MSKKFTQKDLREARLNVKEAQEHLNVVLAALGKATNPVPMGKIAKATKRFEAFHDHQSKHIDEYDVNFDVAVKVGVIDAIEYTTERGAPTRVELYRHDFKKHARPLLCVTENGKNLFSLGGHFQFTERGFVDKPRK